MTFKEPLAEFSDDLLQYEGKTGYLVSDWDWYEIDRIPYYRRYDVQLDSGEKVQFVGWQLRLESEE